ncbi:MAG: 4-(cytidine 5'-diphospho)-2-C-methyl-D-erythritol kinase [Clostridiales bacterium]|nr:4-(cytidine 5'-diphospho)-2-C-methyl-D-erythritol kinase [Clostridiales bacterium]
MIRIFQARAKINLVLDVKRKMENGYHEVDMIMQKIDLYDEIFMKRIPNGIKIETNCLFLPTDSKNIAYKAAKLMIDQFQLKSGIYIKINKNIPIAAGLAGGSSNAAAVISGMNEIFEIGLSLEEMMKLGAKIGSDVPFCFLSGAARAEGVGDILTPVKGLRNVWVVLTKPNISVSTAEIYQNLIPEDYENHPDVEGMIEALDEENIYKISEKLENVLEHSTFRLYPNVECVKKLMKSFGAKGVLMSGSGPSIFGLFSKEHQAKAAFKNFKKINQQTFLIKTFDEVEKHENRI